jgi:aspartyl-tRNA(Asn)/glutamyl-tRNA(Gln) amidotransferase subunit A
MHRSSLPQLRRALDEKKISSVELTQLYLDRSKQFNGELNAYITLCDELALERAGKADKIIASGDAGLLTGIPIAHKDIFCTKDVKTSCGSKMLDNFISPYESTVTEKLNTAGMVMLGKTNMDEFAMGSSNETSFYGVCKNPWNLDHVPGGSSGGSASAVAACIAPIATGTDTGGSIRQPASLTGITGLKPTYGRVSRYGMIAFASSFDAAGPMCRTAEGAAWVLNAIAGVDPKDATSSSEPVEDYTAGLNDSLKGLTVGLPKEYFCDKLDGEIAAQIDVSLKILEKQGVKFKPINLPNSGLGIAAYYVIASAECSANLSRFDGVRYGYRCDDPKDLFDLYCRTRQTGFGDEVKRRLLTGTYALSAGFYDAYYLQALKVRRLIKQDFMKAFEGVDLIASPTSPCVAFKVGEKKQDPISMYLSDNYTVAVNLVGLPAISVPAGFVKGLPVGLQFIAPYFKEAKLLNVAHQFQQETDWHTLSPEKS